MSKKRVLSEQEMQAARDAALLRATLEHPNDTLSAAVRRETDDDGLPVVVVTRVPTETPGAPRP